MANKTRKSSAKGRNKGKRRAPENAWSKAAAGFRKIIRRAVFIFMVTAASFLLGYGVHYYISRPVKPPSAAIPSPTPKRVIPPKTIPEKETPPPMAYVPPPPPVEQPPPLPSPEVIAPPLKKICLIVDDFGYNFTDEVRRFLDLDARVNVAILPGHPYSRKVMEYAVQKGHEVIVHAPFEGIGNTEPHYIHKGESSIQVHALLEQWFKELPAAVGMNNHQGSLATADAKTMAMVMQFLKQKGKLFVDSLTVPESQGYHQARSAGIAAGRRTAAFLDNSNEEGRIREHINQWLSQAKKDVIPIAIAHVTKTNTRQALTDIIPRLESMGYTLVPVSEAVKTVKSELPSPPYAGKGDS
jgi:polysaccharide deacetylase 2 family uncharacterized protein YibQ